MIKGSWADVIENKYNTEKRCEKLFLSHLWPDGIECPRCKKSNRITNKISANKQKTFVEFRCQHCGKKIHEKIDCIFTRSQLSFRDWLKAVYRIAIKQKSTSSVQMEDELGIYQQAAWHLFIRISQLANQDIKPVDKLKGEVEMDEWYSNGDPRYRHNINQSFYGSDKGIIGESIPVFGMISRPIYRIDENGKKQILENSKIVLKVLNLRGQRSVAAKDIKTLIDTFISESASVTVYTDEAKLYETENLLGERDHQVIPHNVTSNPDLEHYEKFVQDNIYTNNIEGTFGQISDYFTGTHNKLTIKHVQKYLDMFCFRWNNRELTTEQKIHKYLSKLPKVSHKNIDEFIGNEDTGRIDSELRGYRFAHPNIVKNLNDMPIEHVENRNNFIQEYQKAFTEFFGPNPTQYIEPEIQQKLKRALPSVLMLQHRVVDELMQQHRNYGNVMQELSEINLDNCYSEIKHDLECRLKIGARIYKDKDIPGEAKQFKQRQYSKKHNEKQKLLKQEQAKNGDKKSEKNSKKSLSSNKK